MVKFALAIAAKDLRMAFKGASGLCQSLLLGLLLIFIFSIASPPGDTPTPHAAAAIFWLSAAFCQILIFNHLYALEEANSVRQSLLLAPAPIQGIWLGKAFAGCVLLVLAQTVLAPAVIVFLGQRIAGDLWPVCAALAAGDIGMAALGSLLGALGHGQSGRESLLSIIIFPLLLPLLLAGISLTAASLGGGPNIPARAWLGVALAFDAIFLAAGLALFGFLYGGGIMIAILAAIAGISLAICQWLVFAWAPVEATLGLAQKIFYMHLPLAWWALFSFFLVFCGSIMWLWRRQAIFDHLCQAAAELGILFSGLALLSGMIWAKKSWGVWWTWDPRLSTTLIMWFIYAGYLLLRHMEMPVDRRRVICAVTGIVAFLDVPLVFVSARIFRSIHPAVFGRGGGLTQEMQAAALCCVIAMGFLWLALLLLRCRQLALAQKLELILQKLLRKEEI